MENREKKEIIISWLTLSVAFSFVLGEGLLNITSIAMAIPISLVAVGTGFVMHELAHKYVAIHYKKQAEFRMWREGLIFALILPLITGGRFLFAAPGAVYIYGDKITTKENGIISLAGPVANLIMGTILVFIAGLIAYSGGVDYLIAITMTAAYVNFFFAMFNLIPLFVLDGAKVAKWNIGIWAVAMLISVIAVLSVSGIF